LALDFALGNRTPRGQAAKFGWISKPESTWLLILDLNFLRAVLRYMESKILKNCISDYPPESCTSSFNKSFLHFFISDYLDLLFDRLTSLVIWRVTSETLWWSISPDHRRISATRE
jgi:hypothetical protein